MRLPSEVKRIVAVRAAACTLSRQDVGFSTALWLDVRRVKPPRVFRRSLVAAGLLAATVAVSAQALESASCESNIVSATVVATFCGHRLDRDEILDLLIVWRGRPGWFQRREGGRAGGGGSRTLGAGTKGHVAQYSMYGAVTIDFDADFDAGVVTIGDVRIPLNGVNTVFVDHVDEPGVRRVSATRWSEPRLPLTGDRNVTMVRRSRELLNYLQCEVPIPAPPRTGYGSQMPIVTVCEKLKSR
ncbi:MAG: hypothetical protein ABI818_16555 [Acidobacteriota bacterium]